MGDLLMAIAMICAGEVGEWYQGRAVCQQRVMECIERSKEYPTNNKIVFECIRQYQRENKK